MYTQNRFRPFILGILGGFLGRILAALCFSVLTLTPFEFWTVFFVTLPIILISGLVAGLIETLESKVNVKSPAYWLAFLGSTLGAFGGPALSLLFDDELLMETNFPLYRVYLGSLEIVAGLTVQLIVTFVVMLINRLWKRPLD